MGDMEKGALREGLPLVAMHAFSTSGIGWLLAVLTRYRDRRAAHAEDKTMLRAREGAAALMRGQYDKAVAAYDEALGAPEIADFIKAASTAIAAWPNGA